MSDQDKQRKEDDFLRSALIAVIAIPIILWLLYYAYEKNQKSPAKMAACEQKCTERGHAGFEFSWPVFGGPKCQCIDMK
jgi:hypothetical protein